MTEPERPRVIQADASVRIAGPDAFVIAGPSGAVLADSSTLRLFSFFKTPALPSQVGDALGERIDPDDLSAAVALLERKGLLGAPRTADDPDCFPEDGRCTLAEGLDVLKGDTRVGLLRTASQELQVFSGLYARIVELVPPAGHPPCGAEDLLALLRRDDRSTDPFHVRMVLADLARQGLLCLPEQPE